MDKGQGTHSTKMGADRLVKNTPNAPNLSAQIVCPSPNVWDFYEKKGFIGRPWSVYFEKTIKYDKISKFYLKVFSSVILFLWFSIEYRRALEYKVSFFTFPNLSKIGQLIAPNY